MADDVVERLRGCPFCGAQMLECHALWPSEGDTDSIIHADLTDCPLRVFSLGTADEGVSVRAAWNRRSPSPDAEAARREAIEAAAKVADAYAARMRTSAEKPHPITGRENRIAICKADAGESLAKAIRALSPPVEGE